MNFENLNWLHLLNLFCVFFSWHVAQRCKEYGTGWWLNMTASSLNAVVLLRAVL